MKWTLMLLTLVGCAAAPPVAPADVTGPYSGPVRRYAVDTLSLPPDHTTYADDLNGDGRVDNELGNVVGWLQASNDSYEHGADLIAAGVIASFVEIQSDDDRDDPTVAVRFLGADGEPAVAVGGALKAGVFASNRSRYTRVPGSTLAHLPLFADADPLVVQLEGLEIDVEPDGANLVATVRGVMRKDDALAAAYAGLQQMIAFDVHQHVEMLRLLDLDGDGTITADEFRDNSLTKLILSPDVQMFDAAGNYRPDPSNQSKDSVSVGFQVHLVPCAAGECARTGRGDHCFDRALDGDETGLDCGGSCAPCAPGVACGAGGDCQTGACDNGLCRAPSCSDGLSDGMETDVDCGGGCPRCAKGKNCVADSDCQVGLTCDAIFGSGKCGAS